MLRCADFKIPLCFVQSISWTKRARTVTHAGGYVSARGFEAAEISAKLHIDVATCKQFGHDPVDIFSRIDSTVTSRVAQPDIFYLGKYAVYPTIEFALTNINKTYIPEIGVIECDCVFSGVRAVKNVARENALEMQPTQTIPKVTLSAKGKDLVLQDFAQISRLVTMPDAVSISATFGSDLDLVSRGGFLDDLLTGSVSVDLPAGRIKYHVVELNLVEDLLDITASVLPPKSAQIVTKTYFDVDLRDIIEDLSKSAGIECKCLTSGNVDYYCAFGAPISCIRDLQRSAGFLMSWRGGVLTCVDVPGAISADTEIEYIDMQADANSEPVSGCYWFDGVNQQTAGVISTTAIRIYSMFRSASGYAEKCLEFARYEKNSIVIDADIIETIDTHSAVYVRSNDSIIQCMVEWYEMDWIANTMRLELHYLGGNEI